MYAIDKACSKGRDLLTSLILDFAWDVELLRMSFSGELVLVDFGDPLGAEPLSRLAEKLGCDVNFVNSKDVPPGLRWLLLNPYSPEQD